MARLVEWIASVTAILGGLLGLGYRPDPGHVNWYDPWIPWISLASLLLGIVGVTLLLTAPARRRLGSSLGVRSPLYRKGRAPAGPSALPAEPPASEDAAQLATNPFTDSDSARRLAELEDKDLAQRRQETMVKLDRAWQHATAQFETFNGKGTDGREPEGEEHAPVAWRELRLFRADVHALLTDSEADLAIFKDKGDSPSYASLPWYRQIATEYTIDQMLLVKILILRVREKRGESIRAWQA
jgi:hypothetical protein